MSYCSNCGMKLDDSSKFCVGCGKPVGTAAAPAPTFSAPVAPVSAPVVVASPAVTVKTKVLGFVGMGLSIGSLFLAALGLLYTLIGIGETGLGFGFAVGFGMFSLPCGIVGMILSKNSMQQGFTSKACTVGKALGLAGIITTGVMMFCGFINLMV